MIPGLLSAVAIIYAIRHTATPKQRQHQPIKITVRPLLHGPLARLMIGITAFEIGNCATTLLILRASQLFMAGHGKTAATQLALFLYVGYNIAAAVISVPAGWHGDRRNPVRVLAAGAVFFAAGYLWFAVGRPSAVCAAARLCPGRAGNRLRRDRRERGCCQLCAWPAPRLGLRAARYRPVRWEPDRLRSGWCLVERGLPRGGVHFRRHCHGDRGGTDPHHPQAIRPDTGTCGRGCLNTAETQRSRPRPSPGPARHMADRHHQVSAFGRRTGDHRAHQFHAAAAPWAGFALICAYAIAAAITLNQRDT